MKNKMEDLYLAYVRPVGKNSMDFFEYEFFFTETPETVWGEDWEQQCPSACGDLSPDESTYSTIKRLKTQIPLTSAQENSCFSMQDCIDGIVCLCYENIMEYDEYPEPYRIVLNFGESYDEVERKLSGRQAFLED